MSSGYVLAMYDVRGKQDFIFRTNKLQEIIGGSWIIRDIFNDYLFSSAESISEKGIFSYKNYISADNAEIAGFDPLEFEKHLEEGYIGEVVYDGGGNFILVYKNHDVFKEVTYKFTKKIMEEIGTLRVLGTYLELDPTNPFKDYGKDDKELHKKHRLNEAQESIISPWACLPIVQVDRKTSQPLIDIQAEFEERLKNKDDDFKEAIQKAVMASAARSDNGKGKMTKEALAKRIKYHSECYRIIKDKSSKLTKIEKDYYKANTDILDNIIEKKGEDSKLAVIYIDGNSMGAQVQAATMGKTGYADCSKALRNFSANIQRTYVEEGIEAALRETDKSFRIVVSAGDEINFIVKARDAFKCAFNYLENLRTKHVNASACAGIAVFHSHSPYSDAYRLAEEACESGKKVMKEKSMSCAAFIDFHICQGATGISLEKIREIENPEGVSRPWMIWGDETPANYEDVKKVKELFNAVGRSNIKGLAAAAKAGSATLNLELKRIYAHQSEIFQEKYEKDWNGWLLNLHDKEKIIHDIVIAYDLWFDEEPNQFSFSK